MKVVFSSRIQILPLLLVLLIIMTGLVAGGRQGSLTTVPCTRTFFSALVQLLPCRAAVRAVSPIPPGEACCNAVRALGQPCLCLITNGPLISSIDQDMAWQLPAKCDANFEPCDLSLSLSPSLSPSVNHIYPIPL
ncbi:hypothetical protein K1719_036553 [Acacia pycnantha]|nr:hypothetical protein K1719_036553 [Acacia pycnantha]